MAWSPGKHLHTVDSSHHDLSWIPARMDCSSACRVVIIVPAYWELTNDGSEEYHVTVCIHRIVDKDTINLVDFLADLDAEIKHNGQQELHISFWDRNKNEYVRINSDGVLMEAFAHYWEIRKLPLQVVVHDLKPGNPDNALVVACSKSTNDLVFVSCDEMNTQVVIGASIRDKVVSKESWGEEDENEYVGVDDEKENYKDLVIDDGVTATDTDYIPQSDEEDSDDDDDVSMDDEKGCERHAHVTDLDNPKIAVGVTFEDGHCFKRCMRQYAVLNEIELAVPYSESKRYRAYCKAKRCKWRIHASRLHDGQTWMIKKIPYKHACASTSKLEHNRMASNAWVKDRVIEKLRKDPTIGAAALKEWLEEKHCIKLSYYVVWDGRQMALDEILGSWDNSFEYAFNFKAELESKSPGSVVEVEVEQINGKHRFKRMFIALKPCIDGFLNGCRPYLGIDSTVLTGKWKGQLASAIEIDGHNWMFPVAYGIFGSETLYNWKWFMQMLHKAIESPTGLVLSTDAGKGIDKAVTSVFTNGVEHRECMRHLVKNFQKRFSGEVFGKHLWPASRAFRTGVFDEHYNKMKMACPKSMQWIEENHKHLWARSKFSTYSKVDYVTNNIAETFNSWIRHEKSLPVIDPMDKIRQMIMDRMFTRARIAEKLTGKIISVVMKELYAKSRNLKYKMHKCHPQICEVSGVDNQLRIWRHTVNITTHECTCEEWQCRGIPCTHSISFIGSLRGLELEDYVSPYYSVQMFKAAYATWVASLPDTSMWKKVKLGFQVKPPLLKRAAGRPRTRRIRGVEEGGSTKKRAKCKRCGGFGHLMKTCNEPVADLDAPPPAPPELKHVRKKNKVIVVTIEQEASLTIPPLEESIMDENNSELGRELESAKE